MAVWKRDKLTAQDMLSRLEDAIWDLCYHDGHLEDPYAYAALVAAWVALAPMANIEQAHAANNERQGE